MKVHNEIHTDIYNSNTQFHVEYNLTYMYSITDVGDDSRDYFSNGVDGVVICTYVLIL